MQGHNVRVETVRKMSTGVDGLSILVVNTVSKMSTKVDLSIIVLAYQVETVSGMSTEVD